MSDPFIGEIRMFAGTFAPRSWAFCDGQLLAVSQNDALFSLFGTTYGGDGRTTFGLPDMRSRIPVHAGTGPGLSIRHLGSKSGSESVTVGTTQLPSHTHPLQGSSDSATTPDPSGNVFARSSGDTYGSDFSASNMNGAAVSSSGGGQAHTNLMPSLAVNFIVALFGVYPARN
jgi:microcystin-dependent protein